MSKTFTIEWCEKKTIAKLNKTVLECTLKDTEGKTYEKVVLWPDEWVIDNYKPGSSITGEYVEKVNGNFTNKSLKAVRTDTSNPSAPKWATKGPSGMVAAVKAKEASIEKAQDRKENSIEKLAVFRDSTLATNLFFERAEVPFSTTEYFDMWEQFRKGFEAKMTNPF